MRKAVLYHPKRAVKKVCGVGMIQSLLMPPFFLFFLVLIHTQSPASSRVFVALELMQSLYATIFFSLFHALPPFTHRALHVIMFSAGLCGL